MLTIKKINHLKSDLAQIEVLLKKYQKIFEMDGETSKTELIELSKMQFSLKKAKNKLNILSLKEEKALLNLGKTKITGIESLKEVSEKIQETIPDFVPVSKGIIDGCMLTIMNYGAVTIDNQSFLEGGTQFFAIK